MCPCALRSRRSLSLSCLHFLPPCHRALPSFLLIYQTSSFPCCHIWYRWLGSMERPVTLHLAASMWQRVWWLVKAPRLSQHTDTDISQRGIAVRSSPPSQRREMKNLELTQSSPWAKRTGTRGGGERKWRLRVWGESRGKEKEEGESKGIHEKDRWSRRGQREVRADRRHTCQSSSADVILQPAQRSETAAPRPSEGGWSKDLPPYTLLTPPHPSTPSLHPAASMLVMQAEWRAPRHTQNTLLPPLADYNIHARHDRRCQRGLQTQVQQTQMETCDDRYTHI